DQRRLRRPAPGAPERRHRRRRRPVPPPRPALRHQGRLLPVLAGLLRALPRLGARAAGGRPRDGAHRLSHGQARLMMARRDFLAGVAVMLAAPAFAVAARESGGATRIGAVAGPQADLLQHARELAAAQGLSLSLDVRERGDGLAADVARGTLDAAA